MDSQHNYCVILAGGVGKRLWPYSRRERPKQFLDFFGAGRTLIQQTYDRIVRFIPPERIFVSTYTDYVSLIHEQLPAVADDHILAEPVQLSTAPATAWASYHINTLDAAANIFVTPCDQLILYEDRFARELEAALHHVATHDVFLALGVPATKANTAYGYIQMGEEVQPGLFTVRSFTEKPDLPYARTFAESGEFLWNTGLFVWNVRTFQRLSHRLMPALHEAITEAGASLTPTKELDIVRRLYPAAARRSIDLVILEQANHVFVQQCSFGWSDVGNWPELHAVQQKDVDGNTVIGGAKVMLSGARDNTVCLPRNVAAVIRGLDGYLVAAEGNVIVVCPNDDPGLVKKLFNEAAVTMGEEYV